MKKMDGKIFTIDRSAKQSAPLIQKHVTQVPSINVDKNTNETAIAFQAWEKFKSFFIPYNLNSRECDFNIWTENNTYMKNYNYKSDIKSIRLCFDLSQAEFADAVGLSRSNIARYEAGTNEPRRDAAEKIYAYFHSEVL